jgi:Fe-S cluster assembly protein SufD
MIHKKSFRGNVDWYVDQFRKSEHRLNGSAGDMIHKIRQAAIGDFTERGYPTTRDEEWKYTNIRPIAEIDFVPAAATPDLPVDPGTLAHISFDQLACCQTTFINGCFSADLSTAESLPAGVKVVSIRDALMHNDPDIIRYLDRFADGTGDSFTALNTAFLWDGIFVFIPEGKILERPVSIRYYGQTGTEPLLNMPRNLIVLGANSQASLIETYSGTGDKPYLTNVVSEIILGENAGLEHIKIQVESDQAYHISSVQVIQQRDSRYKSNAFTFGGQLVRNNFNLLMNDQGIVSELNGLYVGTGDQLIDNHTTIDHAKPNCHSEELYKGVLDDRAHGVFHGKIFVRPDAQKTNAIQSNNCILLSENATIDTKPQLEIFADDVRCTHGATVGQLNEDAFFYMRSRGIDRARARQLMIYAFANEVIDRVTPEPVREKLMAVLADKLHTVKPA